MPASLQSPVAASDRIAALDILRAFALFGVFLMNVAFFGGPIETSGLGLDPDLAGANRALAWFEYVVMEGKFWTLFAMLFGMGFAVMLERADATGRSLAKPYLRRTLVLFAMGVAHATLVWAGDILHAYAFSACVLLVMLRGRAWWLLLPVPLFALAFHQWGGRANMAGVIAFVLFACAAAYIRRGGVQRLWHAGVALYAAPSCVILALNVPKLMSPPSPGSTDRLVERAVNFHASILDAERVNASRSIADDIAHRWTFLLERIPTETYLLCYCVGVFLIGVWFVRSGVMRDLRAHAGLLARIAGLGIGVGLAGALTSLMIETSFDPLAPVPFTAAAHVMQLANLPLSLGLGCALLWCLQAGARLHWLAPVGRMALTNYLMQSVVGTLAFLGYGLGLEGRLDRIDQLAFVVGVFAVQVLASRWWLARFHFGPMEWLWRAATYGTWPPMRRGDDTPLRDPSVALP